MLGANETVAFKAKTASTGKSFDLDHSEYLHYKEIHTINLNSPLCTIQSTPQVCLMCFHPVRKVLCLQFIYLITLSSFKCLVKL